MHAWYSSGLHKLLLKPAFEPNRDGKMILTTGVVHIVKIDGSEQVSTDVEEKFNHIRLWKGDRYLGMTDDDEVRDVYADQVPVQESLDAL